MLKIGISLYKSLKRKKIPHNFFFSPLSWSLKYKAIFLKWLACFCLFRTFSLAKGIRRFLPAPMIMLLTVMCNLSAASLS